MALDDRVSTAQIQKAVKSLMVHSKKKKKETQEAGKTLFADEDENVWLVVTTKTMSPSLSFKPQRIPIAHPIVDPRTAPICLITKDPQREYKDLLQKHNINFISRVVGITKLKGKFSPFDARRELAREYGLFLADERVIPLLPNLLGKAFFKKKKQPIPVNLQRTNLKAELESAISSTYLHQNAGTCTSIKIGHSGMDASKVIQNTEKAIPSVVRKLHLVNTKRGKSSSSTSGVNGVSEEEMKEFRETAWENIQSLGIKTHSSVCLPIWSCSLSERWISPPSSKLRTKEGLGNGTAEDANMEGDSDHDDDTMSEGENGKDSGAVAVELSRKMAESSLTSPKKPKIALPVEGSGEGKDRDQKRKVKEKKRKAEEQGEDDSRLIKKSKPSMTVVDPSPVADGNDGMKTSQKKANEVLTKRSSRFSSQSNSTSSLLPKQKQTQVMPVSEAPETSKTDHEKTKKGERARAIDFMEGMSIARKTSKKQDTSKVNPSLRAETNGSANLIKEKKEEKVEKRPEKKEKVKDQIKRNEGGTKEKMKARSTDEEHGTKALKTDGISPPKPKQSETASKPSIPSSDSSIAPSSMLKSALKKPDSTAGLTPEELAEKKTRKASFSVSEKKKEKLGKALVSSGKPGHRKSGKGGKSKVSLVGRGPKM